MSARRLLVLGMFASLVASVAAGIAMIFVPSAAGMGNIAGSTGIAVVACGMLLANGKPGPDNRMTLLQRVWVIYVVVPAATGVAIIWVPAMQEPEVVIPLAAWIVYGLASFLAARPALQSMSAPGEHPFRTSERILLLGAIAAMGGGMCCQVALGPDTTGMIVPWLVAVVLVHSAVAASGARAIRGGSRAAETSAADRRTARACIAVSCISLAAWIAFIVDLWNRGSSSTNAPLLAFGTASASIAAALSVWCGLRPIALPNWAGMMPGIAAGLVLFTGAMTTYGIIDLEHWTSSNYWFIRCFLSLLLVDTAVLIALTVAVRAGSAARGSADFVRPIAAMRARCPRCSASMSLHPGENACGGCALVLVIGFRDDACPACGYDLRPTASPSCPECGRARQVPALDGC